MPDYSHAEIQHFRNTVAGAANALGDVKIRLLAAAADALALETGCFTPEEEFIQGVLNFYSWGMLTPANAEESWDNFKGNFNDGIELARMMYGRHPELFGTAKPPTATELVLPPPPRAMAT